MLCIIKIRRNRHVASFERAFLAEIFLKKLLRVAALQAFYSRRGKRNDNLHARAPAGVDSMCSRPFTSAVRSCS
jgi:hypothetical protein